MTEKKEHPFAYALRWVADGESLQAICGTSDEFRDITPKTALLLIHNHCMGPLEFRIKPRTIKIGAYDVPEPMRVAPECGTRYYILNAFREPGVGDPRWANGREDNFALKSGMCWANSKDAELAAKAIRELLTGAAE